jgi:pyruvate,orthophosphate dikinase
MFFAPERILAVREMILADSEEERRAALAKILPMQRADFIEIFRAMDGLPVTIRLLDPPLHEFLPHTSAEIAEVARDLGAKPAKLARAVEDLREANPMLGHRGCRLAISFPEIYETQARAIAEAAVAAHAEGIEVHPEIMIPFVSISSELRVLRPQVAAVIDAVFAEAEVEIPYLIGTMIELPRACLIGDLIARHADFFSFDRIRAVARRQRPVPPALSRDRSGGEGPVRCPRPRGSRGADPDRRRKGPIGEAQAQDRDLRRARW